MWHATTKPVTRGTAHEVLDEARQRLTLAYDRTSGAAGRLWDGTVQRSRQNLGTTVLLAFGVGVGVGTAVALEAASRRRPHGPLSRAAEAVRGALRR